MQTSRIPIDIGRDSAKDAFLKRWGSFLEHFDHLLIYFLLNSLGFDRQTWLTKISEVKQGLDLAHKNLDKLLVRSDARKEIIAKEYDLVQQAYQKVVHYSMEDNKELNSIKDALIHFEVYRKTLGKREHLLS